MIYVVGVIGLVVTSFFSFGVAIQRERRLFAYGWLMLLVMFSGLRWKTGTDWDPYYELFYNGGSLNDYMALWHYEIGYKFLNWFFFTIFGEYSIWLAALSFLVLLLKIIPVRNHGYVIFALFILITSSFSDLFPTRQQLAVSLVVFATYMLIARSAVWWFLSIVLFATLFHYTSVVALSIYFLRKKSVISSLLCALIASLLVYMMLKFAQIFGGSFVAHQLDVYAKGDASLSIFGVLQKLVVLGGLLAMRRVSACFLGAFESAALSLYVFGTVMFVSVSIFNEFLTRIALYFLAFEYIAVASTVYAYRRYCLVNSLNFNFFVVFFILSILYSIKLYGQFSHYSDLYYPYETIFERGFKETY